MMISKEIPETMDRSSLEWLGQTTILTPFFGKMERNQGVFLLHRMQSSLICDMI